MKSLGIPSTCRTILSRRSGEGKLHRAGHSTRALDGCVDVGDACFVAVLSPPRVCGHPTKSWSHRRSKKMGVDFWSVANGKGLTLVHVRAELEHIRDTFMGPVGLRGAQRQRKVS